MASDEKKRGLRPFFHDRKLVAVNRPGSIAVLVKGGGGGVVRTGFGINALVIAPFVGSANEYLSAITADLGNGRKPITSAVVGRF